MRGCHLPTAAVRYSGPPSLTQLDRNSTHGDTPVVELFTVCKRYLDDTGAPTTGPDVTIQVSGPGYTGDVTVSSGQCKDVWIAGGAGETVTVTETVPSGYTTSYVKKTLRADGTIQVDAPVSSNTASDLVSGSGDPRGVVVIFTNAENPPPPAGCTYTQGYWKTHSEFGPAPYDDTWAQLANGASTPFFLSGQTWYQVFWQSPGGNAYYMLAVQYMAASLSILNGADPTAAQAALNAATTLFNTYTPAHIGALKGSSPLRQQFIALAGTLDQYNNGIIGPGHCGDE